MASRARQRQGGAASRRTCQQSFKIDEPMGATENTSSVRVCMGRSLFFVFPVALLTSKTCGGWFGIVALHEPCTDQQAAESLASMRASQM